jgi:serine/threonine protein kinase
MENSAKKSENANKNWGLFSEALDAGFGAKYLREIDPELCPEILDRYISSSIENRNKKSIHIEDIYTSFEDYFDILDGFLRRDFASIRNVSFDRYILRNRLADGGFGIVFEALHEKLNDYRAVKVAKQEASHTPTNEIAAREALHLSMIKHPNVIAILDCFTWRSFHFIVTERVHGQNFEEIVIEGGCLDLEVFLPIALQCLNGLNAIHSVGLIHRDIKPTNLMRDDQGTIKFIDFGSSLIANNSQPGRLTEAVQKMTTVACKAPESMINSKNDIYSLGATFHYLLSGQYFDDNRNPPRLSLAHNELEQQIHDAVFSMLSPDMVLRPSLEDLIVSFASFSKQLDAVKSPISSVPRSVSKTRRTLIRGELFDDFVDATFLFQQEVKDDVTRIKRVIKEGSLMPSQFLYGSERGTLRWLDLCSDPHYEVFQDSARFIEQRRHAILESCGSEFLASLPDYISLGPGNGQKDKSLISSLVSHAKGRKSFYYPLDISLMMLSRAVQTIASEKTNRSMICIKAVRSDFRDLNVLLPVFDFRPEPNLFVLLGNTLGNMSNEGEFLQQLYSAMSEQDRAIIEVRLISDDTNSPGGSQSKRMSFNFTPLESVGVLFDESRLSFKIAKNLSVINEAKTIVGEYADFEMDGEHIEKSTLTYIHHYNKDEFRKALEKSFKFKVEQDFYSDRNVLFVISKSNSAAR